MITNIETTRNAILESVNVGQLLEQLEPQSMQGLQLKKQLVESFNANRLSTVTALTELLFECHKIQNVDAAVFQFASQISEKLSDSIQAKLVFCSEAISASRSNPLLEQLSNTIETVLESNESETIVNTLRSGVLKPYQSIPAVKLITESIKIVEEDKGSTDIHEAYRPVSYVEKGADETIFVRLHNSVIGINESHVMLTNTPSQRFTYLSSVVEAMSYNSEKDSFSITHKELGQFNISENGIERISGESTVLVENVNDFISDMSLIIEAKNANDKLSRSIIAEQKQFVDTVISLHANIDKLRLADNIVLVENKKYHEKFALIVTEEFSYVLPLKTNRFPLILEKFVNINESLARLNKLSGGYDASHFVTEALEKTVKVNEEKAKQIAGQKSIVEELKTKFNDIVTKINEEKSSASPNTEVLEKLTTAKNKTNALIVEQSTILAELLN